MSGTVEARLRAAGFDVHYGDDPQDGELFGRFWWTLSRPGWSGIESQPDTSDNEVDAWLAALDFALSEVGVYWDGDHGDQAEVIGVGGTAVDEVEHIEVEPLLEEYDDQDAADDHCELCDADDPGWMNLTAADGRAVSRRCVACNPA